MTKAKLFSHFHGVYKKNPYHDPKTGRFTFAPGGPASGRSGGSGSFTPAKSVEEAKAYATEKLGFKSASYNYNYIDSSSGMPVSGTLDMDTINHINGTITEIQDRYPELKGAVAKLECSWGMYQYYASVEWYDRDNPYLIVSSPLYSKGIQHVKDEYQGDVETGFHVAGTDYRAVLWHEYGHVYAGLQNKKSNYDPIRGRKEEEWARQAASQFSDVTPNTYYKQVSIYAKKNKMELFAESFGAYNTMDSSNKYITALMEAAGVKK